MLRPATPRSCLIERAGRPFHPVVLDVVPIDSAMQSDVPGYTWGLASALAHHGVKYISIGPNHFHRMGYTFEWGDKPFWWVIRTTRRFYVQAEPELMQRACRALETALDEAMETENGSE